MTAIPTKGYGLETGPTELPKYKAGGLVESGPGSTPGDEQFLTPPPPAPHRAGIKETTISTDELHALRAMAKDLLEISAALDRKNDQIAELIEQRDEFEQQMMHYRTEWDKANGVIDDLRSARNS